MEDRVKRIEKALDHFLPERKGSLSETVTDAMRYSLLNGGKRVRAVLTLAFCELCGGDEDMAMPFACAVEMVHAYSLIHDDLPCMDNDDMRRGKPSNHKVYGENYALLAGDGLLTKAFETALSSEAFRNVGMERAAYAAAVLARCAGEYGMVGGQCIDLATENRTVSLDELCEKDTHHGSMHDGLHCGGGERNADQCSKGIRAAHRFGVPDPRRYSGRDR